MKVTSDSGFYGVMVVKALFLKTTKSENPLFSYIVQVTKVYYKSSLYKKKRRVKNAL